MKALQTTRQLLGEVQAEVEAFDPEEVDDIGEWMRDNLLPLFESLATAIDELAQETAAGFAETADVLAEVLDDDDEDEGYLIPAEITQSVEEVFQLGAGIIRALIDKTPLDALASQIAAYDAGGKAVLDKMGELTEDDEDEDEDEETVEDDDGAIEGDADASGDIEE